MKVLLGYLILIVVFGAIAFGIGSLFGWKAALVIIGMSMAGTGLLIFGIFLVVS